MVRLDYFKGQEVLAEMYEDLAMKLVNKGVDPQDTLAQQPHPQDRVRGESLLNDDSKSMIKEKNKE